MSRLSLEIPGSRYYTNLPHQDQPLISQSFDSRGESPLQHNSVAHESPYSSLNGALRPANPQVYPPSDFQSSHSENDTLHQANLYHRRDLPPPSHLASAPKTGPERLMSSRRGRTHSPYPVIGHMPDPSSSQRQESRFRNSSATGSYPHPQQQDLSTSTSHHAGSTPNNHIYVQQTYGSEAMPYHHPTQSNYPADHRRYTQPQRQREPEAVPTLTSRGLRNPSQPPPLNYRELMQCYSGIMSVAAQDPPTSGDLRNLGDLMRNQAMLGLRMFENISETVSPTSETRPGENNFLRQSIPSGAPTGPSSPPQGRRGRDAKGEGQVCKGCDATSTPEWRRGPLGPRTLCNACGLVYAKMLKRRSREANAAKSGAHKSQDVDSAEEGSEFETTESPVSDPHDKR